ncbi:hypothetical protein ACJW30_11G118200 [Castanea mollissima]
MKLMKPCIEVEIEDCDDIIVDVPLAIDLNPDEQPDCCIYRVPETLHKVNEEAYTPMLISIGPFHHHEEKLKKMEQLKLRYFKEALYRTKRDQKDLAKYIVENEVRIRHCYAEEFHNINSKEFIKMILLDSIFIIEHLLRTKENSRRSSPSNGTTYFECLNCSFDDYQKILEGKQVRHLADFPRHFLLPPKWKFGKSIKRLPCATKLAEAKVEFREVKNRRLLDIRFRKNCCFPCLKCLQNMQPVLELQSFIVGDATECVIRNLTTFEQCHYPQEAIICNYIVLLAYLIDTAEDVDLLAVATLINKLCHQIMQGNHSCYYELSEQIRGHYNSCWSKLMASFTNLYFRDFWRGATTVVAILVMFFTFWNFVTPSIIHR